MEQVVPEGSLLKNYLTRLKQSLLARTAGQGELNVQIAVTSPLTGYLKAEEEGVQPGLAQQQDNRTYTLRGAAQATQTAKQIPDGLAASAGQGALVTMVDGAEQMDSWLDGADTKWFAGELSSKYLYEVNSLLF